LLVSLAPVSLLESPLFRRTEPLLSAICSTIIIIIIIIIIMYHIDDEKKHLYFVLATIDLYRLLSITIYGKHDTASYKTFVKTLRNFSYKVPVNLSDFKNKLEYSKLSLGTVSAKRYNEIPSIRIRVFYAKGMEQGQI
jgi:hypothetical protein